MIVTSPAGQADPGWRPKLVALDLDGTVVGYGIGLMPTVGVIAAVASVLQAGVPVVIATGRAVPDTIPTALALGLDGIQLVCSNGAVIYDADAGAPRQLVTIDPGPAVRGLAARLPEASFAAERGVTGFLVTDGFEPRFSVGAEEVADLDALLARPTTRLICTAPASEFAEMAQVAAEVLDPKDYGWHLGYSNWLDVTAPGVSKATGAACAAVHLGVNPADVLAIGDGSNDLSLFAWAGHAVAMGQAPQEVRDAADAVTGSVADDGVATALGWWFG